MSAEPDPARPGPASPGTVGPVRLDVPKPFAGQALLEFLGGRAVAGVESYATSGERTVYARTLRLAHGPAAVALTWDGCELTADLLLNDLADADEALRLVRQLCDLDVDPVAVDSHLGSDDRLAGLVGASPGLRVPGTVDAHELCFRAMIGQQISLAGAANCAGKLAARFGDHTGTPRGPRTGDQMGTPSGPRTEIEHLLGQLSRLFPTAAALASADPDTLPMPRARGRALVAMGAALASGDLELSPDVDPVQTRTRLLACSGVGPWTADYVLMRALRVPDVLLTSDLVIARELTRRRITDGRSWSPWSSYATMHLWRGWTHRHSVARTDPLGDHDHDPAVG